MSKPATATTAIQQTPSRADDDNVTGMITVDKTMVALNALTPDPAFVRTSS